MLGLTATGQKWVWSAGGKHPAARDFLRVGQQTPIGTRMSDWVDKGFNGLGTDLKTGRLPRFWRFWARGGGKNELVCGVLRDSCDSVGRVYPFLVLGTGGLPGCEEQWDLLPYGCETTWKRIEYLCTKNYADVAGIERELLAMRAPLGEWLDFSAIRDAGICGCQVFTDFGPMVGETGEQMTLALDRNTADPLLMAGLLLKQIREQRKVAPNLAFIGGTAEVSYLSIFWRPLLGGDFAALWG